MSDYLRCPMPHCTHQTPVGKHTADIEAGTEKLTAHLAVRHDLPQVSASYEAGLVLPITAPKAA